ncbi:hypothetical protein C8R47DRAFT_965014 [Mycena vitilis]|nr:hypothetical protein C8R47DRAFT_965014 [Mycena vitilis]
MSTVPSLLETVLSCGDLEFLLFFFRYWDPSAIFLLSQLNFRLLNIVRWYQAAVWDVPSFLAGWFARPLDALKTLETSPALFCGPGVLQFFDRCSNAATRLDICVGFGGLAEIGRFLMSEGYSFRPGATESHVRDFDLVTIMESAHFPERELRADGDKSATQEDHGSRLFRFIRFDRRVPLRVVIVHLVRCEPHRFIFSSHSTSFANYISSTHAVALFARSTFCKRKSYVGCQERAPEVDESVRGLGKWLRTYECDLGRLRIVGSTVNVDPDVEIGERWIGDSRCWILPTHSKCEHPVISFSGAVQGPAFEVLDWTSGVTRHGSYLRIGEPFMWR